MALEDRVGFARVAGVSGLAAGTVVETACRSMPVEAFRPGDVIGAATLAHMVARPVFEGTVRIAAQALGPGLPTRPISLARGQRVSVPRPAAMDLVGHAAPWMRAGDLLGLPGITPSSRAATTLFAPVLSAPDTLRIAGVEVEPLIPSAAMLADLPRDARAALIHGYPAVTRRATWAQWLDGRPELSLRELRWLWDHDWISPGEAGTLRVSQPSQQRSLTWRPPGTFGR
ncbi:MAG: Hint domain-containing protein [Pseudomonadota bacterium]